MAKQITKADEQAEAVRRTTASTLALMPELQPASARVRRPGSFSNEYLRLIALANASPRIPYNSENVLYD